GFLDAALIVRKDLNVICMAHTQIDREDSGYIFTHIMTSGKKLNRITLEAKFPVVLLAKCADGKYLFETHANNSTAKTPLGAFEEDEIPNDLQAVLNTLAEYR
ncbi:MAG: ATP-binding protein, partial [Clostridia bacterium]|nr:ATP-binding protein [Clostridia bacterium]